MLIKNISIVTSIRFQFQKAPHIISWNDHKDPKNKVVKINKFKNFVLFDKKISLYKQII